MEKIGPIEKLGTIWWFEFFDLLPVSRSEVQVSIVAYMEQFEEQYSRFRPDSVVSTLNREGKVEEPTAEFLDILQHGIDAYRATDGVFNMTVGGVLESKGYGRAFVGVPVVTNPATALTITETQVLVQQGVHIDIGGFGKGYLIDLLYIFLRERFGLEQVLINGGGDMYVSGDASKVPIRIGLQHPTEQRLVGSLDLLQQGFAASSPYLRRWKSISGTEEQHLVGTDTPHAVYVVAPTACLADVWSTALAIRPTLRPPQSIQWWWFDGVAGLVREGKAA